MSKINKPPMSRLSKATREMIADLGSVRDVTKTLKEFDRIQNSKPKRKHKPSQAGRTR